MDILELVNKYDAPLYVYDAEVITRQYERFVSAFDVPDLEVHYACKALSNLSILNHIKGLGAGLDCVSLQEVQLGLAAGFSPDQILFTPNNVSEEEYEQVIAIGAKINVDSLPMLEYMGSNHPSIPLCVRFNPHMMAGGHRKISVGHIDSKFGISVHQLPHVLRIVEQYNINVEGIHVHTGSDILDSEIFLRAANIILDVAKNFDTVKYVDFGSGFKVSYKEGGLATDIEQFGRQLSDRFNSFCEELGRPLSLHFEPGKFIVSEAGAFLVRVNSVKQTTACTFIGVDSGFNHLIRPMFYDAHHEIKNISNPEGNLKIYDVVGYICETDTFATNRRIAEVRPGDILQFSNAGAYCYQMASNYNSRYRPAEVLMADGQDQLIRKRECFDDLIRLQNFSPVNQK